MRGTRSRYLDRAALESDHVSRELHHWIDCTFGYKLSGEAALANKNVVLNSEGSMPHERGIVQLFHEAHPARLVNPANLSGVERMRMLEDAMAFCPAFEEKAPRYAPVPWPSPYTPADDIFALGCLAAELGTPQGKALFTFKTMAAYFKGEYTPNLSALPPDVAAQVGRMIARDPRERPKYQIATMPRVHKSGAQCVWQACG